MHLLTKVLCLLLIVEICSCFESVFKGDKLIAAHVIHRHGDRNINSAYPKDPYKNKRYWPGGFGALTKTGKHQTHELGKFLRRRYDSLIGLQYSSEKMYYRSTNRSRTIDSAKSCAAGLYPKSNLPPIHTVPRAKDFLLYPQAKCALFKKLFHKYLKSRRVTRILKKHRPLLKFIEKNSGKRIRSLADIANIYDTLHVEHLKGFKLPKWVKEALKSRRTLEYLVGIYYEAYTHSVELKKLKAGYLLGEILEHFHKKTKSILKPDRNLWIYSAHDITIAILLNALKLYNMKIPPYASSVHFELYKRASDYYVQVIFRTSATDEHPRPLNIPDCGAKCPLAQFYKLYKRILPTKSFAYACKARK